MKRSITNLFSSTYIHPWKDRPRTFNMVYSIPGLFGAALMELTLSYHMAGYGATTATLFHLLRMGLLGALGIPLTYWLVQKIWAMDHSAFADARHRFVPD